MTSVWDFRNPPFYCMILNALKMTCGETDTDKIGPNAANDVTLKNGILVGVRKKWWRNYIIFPLNTGVWLL